MIFSQSFAAAERRGDGDGETIVLQLPPCVAQDSRLQSKVQPVALVELIQEGRLIVERDPHHDLPAGFRCRLYRQISANERRKLGIASIVRVLPLWERVFMTDRSPHQMLELAERTLDDVGTHEAERQADSMWTHCDDLAYKYADRVDVIAIAYGAVQVLRDALAEEPVGCGESADDTANIDVDPYGHDGAFCAAVASAGGASWQAESDAEKRREFWMWWLTTAGMGATTDAQASGT